MFHQIRARIAIAAIASLTFAMPAFAELDESGLHAEPWIQNTFLDLRDDLADASAQNKRLLILIEQRGCIYCTRMHEEVFSQPDIAASLSDDFYVVRLNMFGDIEVTDFDGKVLSEKAMVNRWHAMFTPTMVFLPETVPDGETATEAAVAVMPGAFEAPTTRDLLQWVHEKRYETGENFQKFVASKMNAAQ